MRRWRTVATATLILIVVIVFFAQQHSKLPETYQIGAPFRETKADGSDSSSSGQTPASAKDEKPAAEPSEIEQHPPPVFPSGDVPQKEGTPPPANNPPGLTHEPDLPPSDAVQVAPSDVQVPPTNDAQLPPSGDAQLPPSNDVQLPSSPDPVPAGFQAEFVFQQDLELDLPVDVLKGFSNNKPHNYDSNGPKTNAYATFMATRNPSLKDPYYMAIHSLVYRILWSPRSRSEKYPFVVFVGDFVTAEQRELLAGAGAIVRELEPLEWNPNVEGIQHRWKDLFAKLNMWKETEFSKVLFLDADAFPVANIDAMFDLAPQQSCIDAKLSPDDHLLDGTSTCEPYVFAGVPQNPFNETAINVNVGSMVLAPSTLMHQRLLQNYVKFDKYDVTMAEQAFLNWQFDIHGAFPPTTLQREWGGFFPSEEEEGKLKVVHEKLWSEERKWLKEEWVSQWIAMTQFYTGEEFTKMRGADGVA